MSTPAATKKGLRATVGRGKDALERVGCWVLGCEVPGAETDTASGKTPTLYQIGTATMSAPVAAAAGASAEPVVVASGLTKMYGKDVVGARDIDIQAHAGEIVAVVGPNGAGKSTTLNMLSGLLRPSGGTATIKGVSTTDTKRLGKVLGVALQTSGLDPGMTAREHFETQAALYGVRRDVAATCTTMLLDLFGLTAYINRQVAQFSIGLQRRLALALALLHDPPVIILDEPTAGLDPQSRRMVWDLLERLRSDGHTIIFSTQLLEEADLLAQRLYVIADGRVIAEGPPSELRKAYGELTIKIRVPGPLEDVAKLLAAKMPHLGEGRAETDCLVFTTTHGSRAPEQVMAVLEAGGVEFLEVSVGRPSLEDAFVRLTGSMMRPEPLLGMGSMGGPLCRCS